MSTRRRTIPRPLSLVRFIAPDSTELSTANYPFQPDASYIFLGEIPNMPGHCVIAEQPSGRMYAGYHSDHFTELSEDEV